MLLHILLFLRKQINKPEMCSYRIFCCFVNRQITDDTKVIHSIVIMYHRGYCTHHVDEFGVMVYVH